MPVSKLSRYSGLQIYLAEDARRGSQPTLSMRPSPPPPSPASVYNHRVTATEDIEYLAWRFHGSGAQFYRIADANAARYPLDLTPGDTVQIVVDAALGKTKRDRSF